MYKNPSTNELAKALYTVNRHAKAAPNPKYLYQLKKHALLKMLDEGKAIKKGLHFSRNPKFSQQTSDVLIECENYYFHIPPTKDDLSTLPHLGKLDEQYRNPKVHMSLKIAKQILQTYSGYKEPQEPTQQRPVFKRLGDSY